MEFDYIGNRCEVSTCKLQDFLPFSCDICKGTYCLSHRSYNTHNCEGQYIKDIYSIECPICQLTVKYSKSEDINEVWNTHYNINCNKVNIIKNNKKCYETSCRTILGLSNKIKCNKCNNEICLSHRAPEDHHCPGILTKNNVSMKSVKKFNNSNINITSNNAFINTSINNNTTLKNEAFLSKFNTTSKNSSKSNKNTIKSTENNKKLKSTNALATGVETCPMCSQVFHDSNTLIDHFNSTHNEVNNNTTNVDIVDSSYNCPYCDTYIRDPVELVQHVESHNANNITSTGDSNRNSNKTECIIV